MISGIAICNTPDDVKGILPFQLNLIDQSSVCRGKQRLSHR